MSLHDLVSRDQAAQIISEGSKPLSAESLRTRTSAFPGFYLVGGGRTGDEACYRRDWLLTFKKWRDLKANDRGPPPKEICWGRQQPPDSESSGTPPLPPLPPLDVVIDRISDWAERERWRRAKDILTRKTFTRIGTMRFEDYRSIYDLKWKDPTDEEVGLFLNRIELEIKSVFHDLDLPWRAPFTDGDDQYFTHLGATNLIGAALRKMFAEEKRWRERAESGEYEDDMPTKPPASSR